MKLLQRDRKALERTLEQLMRGQAYLRDNSTLVCRRSSHATTSLHLTNQAGEICVSVDKEIGSELALLHSGIESLWKLLKADESSL